MLITDPAKVSGGNYDIVIVGSGFGSAFFLHETLRLSEAANILVLEWGRHNDFPWQWEHQRNSPLSSNDLHRSDSDKPWNYTIGLGGGTNCWFAQTPRLHPSDFRLRSSYGIGADWPIGYDDLEPFYMQAEQVMSVSGDSEISRIMPRSGPFPQPPHVLSTPDTVMKAARPGAHFAMPTARARLATSGRNRCCASMRCWLCPADAKFTANNGLMGLFEDQRVSVLTGAEVRSFETTGRSISNVTFRSGGRDYRVNGDLIVLGANAIQSPAIMLRSGLGGGKVGLGLHESFGAEFEAMLDGMNNFDGSTITTGLNFSLYDGEHRRESGASLVYFENRWPHGLRADAGRLRQILPLVVVVEDLLDDRNRVTLDESDNAFVSYSGPADYALRGMDRARVELSKVLSPLPIESLEERGIRPTESHLQGTLRMGNDPTSSVIDRHMVHHQIRNLVIVGTATFPTCSCVNPSLTAAALSIRAARELM